MNSPAPRPPPDSEIACGPEFAKKNSAMSTPEQPTTPQPLPRDVFVNRVETFTREEPVKALSAAFGVGILMTLLPVGTFVSAIARLVLLLARPVLIILGLVKIADTWAARSANVEEPPADETEQPPI